jgi:glutathione S-transferase
VTTFYWIPLSHPSHAARRMLDLKRVDYDTVTILPNFQRVHLRIAGFRGGTVPALKLDGRRLLGSRAIARALEELYPAPPLYPAEPALRARVEEAERWGDEELQPVPRRIARYGARRSLAVRRWVSERTRLPAPGLAARLAAPSTVMYARFVESDGRRADEEGVRADLAALPAMLDRVDALVEEGTLTTDPPNAATFQVLASIRLLDRLSDLTDEIGRRPSGQAARALFPDYPGPFPPFLPPELRALAVA